MLSALSSKLPFRRDGGQYRRQPIQMTDDAELEAAFDDEHEHGDDHDDPLDTRVGEHLIINVGEHEADPLSLDASTINNRHAGTSARGEVATNSIPGAYDFEPPVQMPTSTSARASFRDRFRLPFARNGSRGYSRLETREPGSEGRPLGGGQQNDGVFGNLMAKPEGVRRADGTVDYVGGDDEDRKEEVLPSYDNALADSSPPYWETTVIAPSGYLGPDDTLVEGLPVGNVFGFAWNLLVSMSFQFVGFLLTYLLHTTHAAKNGSRAGLGVTLIQYGFYIRQRTDEADALMLNPPPATTGDVGSDALWYWGQPVSPIDVDSDPNVNVNADGAPSVSATATATLKLLPSLFAGVMPTQAAHEDSASAALAASSSEEELEFLEERMRYGSFVNEWLSFVLMLFGWLMLVTAVVNYLKAVRYARALRAGGQEGAAASQAVQAMLD
ncbi:hypothetical protein BT69DRAFT_1346122 [Atractiella rhizophila]|nr:hypothetical protein BT69DRAFT_1346122 [Atractiella rhizophila]